MLTKKSLADQGSNAAFQAILSSSVVLLELSYCIPIALLLIRGRHLLRPESFPSPTWTLGPVLGPITNVVALSTLPLLLAFVQRGSRLLTFWPYVCAVFTSVTVVFFLFPGETHPTGNSMSASAALPLPRRKSRLSNADNHIFFSRLRRRRDWLCPPPLRRNLDLPRTETLYRPARPRRFARARARRGQSRRSEPPGVYAEGVFVPNGDAGRAPPPAEREGRRD